MIVKPDSRILIVEDESKLARLLADYLVAAGFNADCLGDGREVVPWVKTHSRT
jgi:two-component system response regulator BaeR